jgi:hypothetical protein
MGLNPPLVISADSRLGGSTLLPCGHEAWQGIVTEALDGQWIELKQVARVRPGLRGVAWVEEGPDLIRREGTFAVNCSQCPRWWMG